MEDVRWPAEQLEEHRLEISNRIRNLFWTVSGDYDMGATRSLITA